MVTKAIKCLMVTLLSMFFVQCSNDNDMESNHNNWKESQLTSGKQGHLLNPVQSFSPKDEYLVYDVRNVGGDIGATPRIERVNIATQKVEVVYETSGQTAFGPGVGAVAYHPHKDMVLFIHGLLNCNESRPYGFTRRTGVAVDMKNPGEGIWMDARDVTPPFTVGAMRGGSHAHSWSGDGKWVTYTYNDDVMGQLADKDPSVGNLRFIAVMAPWGSVEVDADAEGENNSGTMFNMAVARVTERPKPGSDEIEKAYEDGWIGQNGYVKTNGDHQKYAVAFLGDVRDDEGNLVTEVFVVDLPEEKPDLSDEQQLAGTAVSRPLPLKSVVQRRITHTEDRKYPGVQGPRQWMKSSPDGKWLYFMMKDDEGRVQIYGVPTVGGEIVQMTFNEFSIDTSFDLHPEGGVLAYGSDEKVYITDLNNHETRCLTEKVADHYQELHGIQWSHSGKALAYNRAVVEDGKPYYQIFLLTSDEE